MPLKESYSMKERRADFPILNEKINGQPLIYLDSAATAQKPAKVIAKIQDYYQHQNANVHRGVYTLSQAATDLYEGARDQVQTFINAANRAEVLFTRGTTESINWVATAYGPQHLQAGDEILVSYLEHHSNLVPWQVLAHQTGAKLRYVALDQAGRLDLADLHHKLNPSTKIVALTHVSNVTGVINPIAQITHWAHQVGAVVVVDGAQAAPHLPVDVQVLDADFYAFSGHKLMGPTGIGVLYGKKALLEEMQPVQYGGEMIEYVGLDEATFQPLPWRLEAGTPNIAGAIGLGAAIEYLRSIGMAQIAADEAQLTTYALKKLGAIEGLQIYGPINGQDRTGVITFNLAGIHPHDVATALDQEGIEVRAGHHCAQPLMRYLGVTATVRVSLYLYNTAAEIDQLVAALVAIKEYFADDFT
ncbi:Cysteine desulfurase SufS [Convivina intestini]|nr:Cysteine desulfurase SufS [Convivina intestini]